MQKLSMRKISILGLVLMAASAVTAAVLPSKSDKKVDKKLLVGSLTKDSANPDDGVESSSVTCDIDSDGGAPTDKACNYDTDNSGTTQGAGSSNNNDSSQLESPAGQGGNNTSTDND